jgi:hypothetical protein
MRIGRQKKWHSMHRMVANFIGNIRFECKLFSK